MRISGGASDREDELRQVAREVRLERVDALDRGRRELARPARPAGRRARAQQQMAHEPPAQAGHDARRAVAPGRLEARGDAARAATLTAASPTARTRRPPASAPPRKTRATTWASSVACATTRRRRDDAERDRRRQVARAPPADAQRAGAGLAPGAARRRARTPAGRHRRRSGAVPGRRSIGERTSPKSSAETRGGRPSRSSPGRAARTARTRRRRPSSPSACSARTTASSSVRLKRGACVEDHRVREEVDEQRARTAARSRRTSRANARARRRPRASRSGATDAGSPRPAAQIADSGSMPSVVDAASRPGRR